MNCLKLDVKSKVIPVINKKKIINIFNLKHNKINKKKPTKPVPNKILKIKDS